MPLLFFLLNCSQHNNAPVAQPNKVFKITNIKIHITFLPNLDRLNHNTWRWLIKDSLADDIWINLEKKSS